MVAVDAAGLAALLAGTVLGGREVVTVNEMSLAVQCDAEELWPAWLAARSVLEGSGRWPVLVAAFGDDAGEPWVQALGDGDGDGEWREGRAVQVVADSAGVDPWSVFTKYGVDEPMDEWELGWAQDAVIIPADVDVLRASRATTRQLERLRLDRRVAASPRPPAQIELSPGITERERVWFTPTRCPCAVVFLSTPTTWEAGARLSFFGALDDERRAALVAAEREWSQRYGAELVASWGTMLQYRVTRRPTTVEQAWELAGQHLAVGSSIQQSQSDIALALLQSDYWFLHDRP